MKHIRVGLFTETITYFTNMFLNMIKNYSICHRKFVSPSNLQEKYENYVCIVKIVIVPPQRRLTWIARSHNLKYKSVFDYFGSHFIFSAAIFFWTHFFVLDYAI